jgi:peptide-methionine (S)-S-oxide reductase
MKYLILYDDFIDMSSVGHFKKILFFIFTKKKIMKIKIITSLLFLFGLGSCNSNGQSKKIPLSPESGKAIAVFAEGCYWCSEHVFESVEGVSEVISGFAGGNTKNPTYEEVGQETTGHAESVMVFYDPKTVSFKDLVTVFFASHDPTTPDQQGPDRGSSYRSIAFYKTDEEKKIIEDMIKELTVNNTFSNPIVTEVKPLTEFYKAKDSHQDYVKNNPYDGYVRQVSIPRYELFKKTYKGKLKSNS